MFRSDIPRLPKPLPRYLPVNADRRLAEALTRSEFRLAADALLLARACGLASANSSTWSSTAYTRSPANGAWLNVPLGKLDTEQMVPLDDETVTLIDRICATRSEGRPLPHPATEEAPSSSSPTTGASSLNRLCATSSIELPKQRASGTSHPTSSGIRMPRPW